MGLRCVFGRPASSSQELRTNKWAGGQRLQGMEQRERPSPTKTTKAPEVPARTRAQRWRTTSCTHKTERLNHGGCSLEMFARNFVPSFRDSLNVLLRRSLVLKSSSRCWRPGASRPPRPSAVGRSGRRLGGLTEVESREVGMLLGDLVVCCFTPRFLPLFQVGPLLKEMHQF